VTEFRKSSRIWVLLDHRAGNRSQCLGVADALGLPYEHRELVYSWRGALPNGLIGRSFTGLSQLTRSEIVPPWPDIVIAAGRRTAPVARQIKRLSEGRTRLVQIMWPGNTGYQEFDLIAVPRHDNNLKNNNIINVLGSPHQVTGEILRTLKGEWLSRLAGLPSPYLALIVGGTTKNRTFTDTMAIELANQASQLARQTGSSLLVTTSRRTGEAADLLIGSLKGPARVYRWGDAGENPYLAFLACADAIIVTGDSMSMCSEACSGTGPVYIYAPSALITAKHKRLHDDLFAAGFARPLSDNHTTWHHAPLNCATEIAREIKTRFDLEPRDA